MTITIETLYPTLVGSFLGVIAGLGLNHIYQTRINENKREFLISYLEHENLESFDRLREKQEIPVDAWNSIINSGNILLFTPDQTRRLGHFYFMVKSYNDEVKRARIIAEQLILLPEQSPDQTATNDRYEKLKEHYEIMDARLSDISRSLQRDLIDLNIYIPDISTAIVEEEEEEEKQWWQFWRKD
jgi:hypothetical protein